MVDSPGLTNIEFNRLVELKQRGVWVKDVAEFAKLLQKASPDDLINVQLKLLPLSLKEFILGVKRNDK